MSLSKIFKLHNRKAVEPFLNEKDAQVSLSNLLGGRMEVKCKYGRVDLITNELIVEVKRVSGWKGALGQIMTYHLEYEDLYPVIALLGTSKNYRVINEVCEHWHIGCLWADKDGTWEVGYLPK